MSATGITEEIVATVLKEKLTTEHVVRPLIPLLFHLSICHAIFTQGVGF
jgi:hypothetical protein